MRNCRRNRNRHHQVPRQRRSGQEERSADLEFRCAEAQLRTLVEYSLVGIHIVRDDRFLYVNPKYEEVFGYNTEELLTRVRVSDLVVREDLDMVLSTIRRRLAGEQIPTRYSFRGRRKDGRILHLQVHGTRIDFDGAYAVIEMVQDITEQREAADRLRASEERYRLVVQASNDVFRDWDVGSGAVAWDPTAFRTFRYGPSDMGSTVEWWSHRLHPDDRSGVLRSLYSVLEGTGDSWSSEYRFRRGDGEYAVVLDRAHAVRTPTGEAVRVMSSMHDMTERARNEETQAFLARASAKLDTSLEADAVLTTLARTCVPFLGDCCLVDSLERERRVVRRVATVDSDPTREPRLVPEEPLSLDDEAKLVSVLGVVRTGEPILVPDLATASSGGYRPDRAHRAALQELGIHSLLLVPLVVRGETLGAVTLGRSHGRKPFDAADLTTAENTAHRAAQALDNAILYQRAQAAIQARDDILAVVAHDLRDPLNVIQMSAGMMRDAVKERRAEDRRSLDVILRLGRQMNELIEDLLDLSTMETGRFRIDVAEVDLRSFIQDAVTTLEPLARIREIELRSRVPDRSIPVWIDSKQMLRVISNLVGNAVKFTPPGGTVTIRAAPTGDQVRIQVQDTGPGIEDEQRARMFDRHWQGDPGDPAGVGLGLTIARGIVDAHGGSISADSEVGVGTTVSCVLPRKQS
jgi:PAS domain S-box-containing protein